MKYRLISTGRLREGVDRARALAGIKKATGLGESKIERELLSGRPKKLISSPDKEKITALYHALQDAGLEVEFITDAEILSKPKSQKPDPKTAATNHPSQGSPLRWKRWLAASLLLILLSLASAGGYTWYWLQRPLPPAVAVAEKALFDNGLVVIGLVDVEKLVTLERDWFGGLDPNALPVDEKQQGLLKELFTGPAHFRENLKQVVFSANVQKGDKQGKQVMLLSGRFNADALLQTLRGSYKLKKLSDNRWSLTEKKRAKNKTKPVCKKDEQKPKKTKPFYVQVSPEWVMLFDDQAHGDKVWERLQANHVINQVDSRWRAYRQGQLASVMVMVPHKAGKAIGGMPGMMAQGAMGKAPEIKAVAASLGVEPLKAGLNANFHLASGDAAWIGEAEAKTRQQLVEMRQNSQAFSPTLSELFSRVSVASAADALEIDVGLDAQIFNDISQIMKEGMGSLFGAGMSSGGGRGEVAAERIDENPQRYADLNLKGLPPFKDKYSSQPPLFSRGEFAVDFKSIQPNKGGVLEIWLEGKVGLPEHQDRRFNDIGKLSMMVNSVQDAAGKELLRDELCISRNELMGRSPNHEEETNANHHTDHGWVWKHVRLIPGVNVEQIARIKGELNFIMPSQVRRFDVPLKAGEAVEHLGLRFYLSGIKPSEISYQVSGLNDHLLEVRGLNSKGQVLRRSWKMSSMDDERTTQSFEGEVKALEIYVAERFFRRKTGFELTNLFRAPEKKEEGKKPQWFAPERIEAKRWHEYAALNMDALKVDPKMDWQIWDKNINPIAEGSWSPIRMFITHTPKQWGNNPMAHIYYPQLNELPGVLSGMSYRVDEPAEKEGATVHYHQASYWYDSDSGEVVVKDAIEGQPIALNNITLQTGLGDNQKLERLKGEIIFRLPTKTRSTRLALNDLWNGQTVDGVTITVAEVSGGMFPGYGLKIEGEIEKLVNLHGLSSAGERVVASPVNFQTGGYWTMTLPFGKGVEEVELVTASAQEVLRYPFDFVPEYQGE
jgi:hypothetical protein